MTKASCAACSQFVVLVVRVLLCVLLCCEGVVVGMCLLVDSDKIQEGYPVVAPGNYFVFTLCPMGFEQVMIVQCDDEKKEPARPPRW